MKREFSKEHIENLRKSHLGYKMPEEQKIKISKSNKGRKKPTRTPEHARKIGDANRGKVVPPEVGRKISTALKGRVFSIEHRKKLSDRQRGSLNHAWKGGVTQKQHLIRTSKEYKFWRRSVLDRDGHRCIWCGVSNYRLHADHIKPFALFPELRFSIDNGRTLCISCHKTTATYGVNTGWEE